MFTLFDHSHESIIAFPPLKAEEAHSRLIFIITASPVLAGAVGDYFRATDEDLSIVWLTSAQRAPHRLGLGRAAWIILDDVGDSTEADLAMLQAAAPEATIMLLAGGRSEEPAPANDSREPNQALNRAHLPARNEQAAWEQPHLLRFHRSTLDQTLASHLHGLG